MISASDELKQLFEWDGDRLEDVRFWCEPQATITALEQIGHLDFPQFDGFVTFEARGFFLAGVATALYRKPTVTVRKHKRFYDKMAHAKVTFMNWKNEEESLVLLKKTLPNCKRVLVVDDILDTGRSLKAGHDLLLKEGIEIVGAFYLLDARKDTNEICFEFPIKSARKQTLF